MMLNKRYLGGNPRFDSVVAFSFSFILMLIFVSVSFWLIMWLIDQCGVYFCGNAT